MKLRLPSCGKHIVEAVFIILLHSTQLRVLRKEIADAEDVAPFIVFNDATLSELSRVQPLTSYDMLAINGIGDTKLARYGDPFLSVIKEHQG